MKKTIAALAIAFASLVFVSCDADKGFEERYNAMYSHMVQMWAQTLEPHSCDIAFYGDSRVAGADWQAAYPGCDVVNLGIGGDRVADTMTRLPLIDALDVKHVFLSIGGNDAGQESFDVDVFKSLYSTLLDEFSRRGIEVVVCTIAGIAENHSLDSKTVKGWNSRIVIANRAIEEIASSRGIVCVDMAALMNDGTGHLKDNLTSDGAHFNEEGNKVMFDALRPYVEKAAAP